MSPKASPYQTREKQPAAEFDVKSHTHPDLSGSYEYCGRHERQTMFGEQCSRQLPATPLQGFSYPSISQYNTYRQSAYAQPLLYHTAPSSYSDLSPQSENGESFLSATPVTFLTGALPKNASDEYSISSFSRSYTAMAGTDLDRQLQSQHPHAQTQGIG